MGFITVSSFTICLGLTVVAQLQYRDPCRQKESEGQGCAPGQECRLVQTGCTTCPPEPVCIQPKLRVSSCRYGDPVLARNLSALSCVSDRDCPSHTTCNFEVMDTQTTCCWKPRDVTPPGLTNPCIAALCPEGHYCENREVICGVPPCQREAVCVRDSTLGGKSGECPRVIGPGICITECETDFDCNGNRKCCSNGCGSVCTIPTDAVATVPTPPSDPCATVRCARGMKCRVQKVQCFHAPCDPIVTCVGDIPLTGKPGECPRVTGPGICITECETDFHCNNNMKCCSNGCGSVCTIPTAAVATVPTPPSDPCATVRCSRGLMCQVEQVQCFHAPCDPIAKCVDSAPTATLPVATTTRPGRCPRSFPMLWFLCDFFLQHCNVDTDCTSGMLCCFASGCGRRSCLRPDLYTGFGGW
ncbi:spore coat protein SP87-like [Haliotis asinina]|uniref:spore coat protein SP87-like n=1 Tax=Haliotis asinina TaxID=109174 RepID=UPI003531A32D